MKSEVRNRKSEDCFNSVINSIVHASQSPYQSLQIPHNHLSPDHSPYRTAPCTSPKNHAPQSNGSTSRIKYHSYFAKERTLKYVIIMNQISEIRNSEGGGHCCGKKEKARLSGKKRPCLQPFSPISPKPSRNPLQPFLHPDNSTYRNKIPLTLQNKELCFIIVEWMRYN